MATTISHSDSLDGNGGHWSSLNSQPVPWSLPQKPAEGCAQTVTVVYHGPFLSFITLSDAFNYSRIIRKFLKMAGVCVVAEESEWRDDILLQGPGTSDHSVQDTVLQTQYCDLLAQPSLTEKHEMFMEQKMMY